MFTECYLKIISLHVTDMRISFTWELRKTNKYNVTSCVPFEWQLADVIYFNYFNRWVHSFLFVIKKANKDLTWQKNNILFQKNGIKINEDMLCFGARLWQICFRFFGNKRRNSLFARTKQKVWGVGVRKKIEVVILVYI